MVGIQRRGKSHMSRFIVGSMMGLLIGWMIPVFHGKIYKGSQSVKNMFNKLFPYYRRCLKSWCIGSQVYEGRCWKHQWKEMDDKDYGKDHTQGRPK